VLSFEFREGRRVKLEIFINNINIINFINIIEFFIVMVKVKFQPWEETMKQSLQAGLTFEFAFQVPESKTVPCLYPESPEFQAMPRVLATGFMVGLFEWACIQAINPHLDWPREQTVGIDICVNHVAATPPGLTVTVKGWLDKVEGRKLTFSLAADDGMDTISEGTHERFVIDAEKFNAKAAAKMSRWEEKQAAA
jgi:fluoroacetyl-CoA thioesterase